jgi:hypothetical protein
LDFSEISLGYENFSRNLKQKRILFAKSIPGTKTYAKTKISKELLRKQKFSRTKFYKISPKVQEFSLIFVCEKEKGVLVSTPELSIPGGGWPWLDPRAESRGTADEHDL